MKHPDEKCNEAQRKFLSECDPKDRRFHELLFMIGNATYRYHQEARNFNPTLDDWSEWIDGLEDPVKSDMKTLGFDEGRRVLSFTRYVMEKNDIGLEEYKLQHLGTDIIEEYRQLVLKGEDEGHP